MSSIYSSYIKRMIMCANGNCKGCTYQYEGLTNTEECKEDLLYDAAEQLEDADKCNAELLKKCKEMEKHLAELEAQLPKCGEWIAVKDWLQIPQEDSGTYRCSACGQVMKYPWNYCPNCGAKMDLKEQNDES